MVSVDMSLDEIINKDKNKYSFGSGRGRGQGRVRRGGFSRGRNSGQGAVSRPPIRRGNIDARWTHDMFSGGANNFSAANHFSAANAFAAPPSLMTSVKLHISNLEFGVSDNDIKELFTEFGALRSAAIHYDRSGRSLGTAQVVFDRMANAQRAISQYNGVHLDGRPMHITLDTPSGAVAAQRSSFGGGVTKRLQVADRPRSYGGNRDRGPRFNRGAPSRRRGGSGGARGGRRDKEKVPTAEELDAEMDSYIAEAPK